MEHLSVISGYHINKNININKQMEISILSEQLHRNILHVSHCNCKRIDSYNYVSVQTQKSRMSISFLLLVKNESRDIGHIDGSDCYSVKIIKLL